MEVFINTELERGHEGRLFDEDEVVVLGKVFEEKPEFTQSFDGHKVGVVNDGEKDFPFGVEGTSFFDETGFAFVVRSVAFEIEGLAEEAQDVVPAMEGAVDDGDDPVLGVIFEKMIFEDGLAGAGFAEEEAEPAELGVGLDDVTMALLVWEQGGVSFG